MTDQVHLARFMTAQSGAYADAVAELRTGGKGTHWMWFIFPKMIGLGSSAMARLFAVSCLHKARMYVAHPVLGARLLDRRTLAGRIEGRSAHDIFGSPDDLKFRSSMTLFAEVDPAGREFRQALRDKQTG